jgi:transcription antitermination factor NusG
LSCLPLGYSQESCASGIDLEAAKFTAYPRWYALFVMSRHEKRLAGHCSERQIESFLPLYQVKHRWKNRCTATLDLPLFPNGLLAHRIAPHPNVEVGDRVCITTGPMAGMEGILSRQKNELRVVLVLEMIGRSVVVEVGAEEICYVGPHGAHTRYGAHTRMERHGFSQPLNAGTGWG